MTCARGALLLGGQTKICSTALLIIGSEKEMEGLPPRTMAKPAWPQHTQEISLSQTKQGMREAGCQMSVFNKMCKIPQEAEKKNQPELLVAYLVETEQTSPAGFPSEPLSQVLLQTQTPELFQIQIDCLFSAPY